MPLRGGKFVLNIQAMLVPLIRRVRWVVSEALCIPGYGCGTSYGDICQECPGLCWKTLSKAGRKCVVWCVEWHGVCKTCLLFVPAGVYVKS